MEGDNIMPNKKKITYSSQFKANVVLEALKEEKTISEIAAENKINPCLISKWKLMLLENCDKVFSIKNIEFDQIKKEYEKTIDNLYTEIGKLTAELNWIKKKCSI